jgi:hypothetical protein
MITKGVFMVWTKYLVAALVLSNGLIAGCAADPDANDASPESIGVTSDALSGLIIASWGGVGTGGPKFSNGASIVLPLNVGNGWVCWLAGVRGTLGTLGSVGVFQASASGDPADGVGPNGWALFAEPDVGLAAEATAVCAPATNLGLHTVGLGSPTIVTSANANDWCGLSEINAFPDGPPHIPWSHASDFATVSNNGSNPQIVVGAPSWTFSGAISDTAEANCARASVSGIWFYHIIAPSSGTASFNLLQNNGTSLPAGTACFLTSLQGAFVNSNFNDGVFIGLTSNGVWSLTATNGKSGWALCML